MKLITTWLKVYGSVGENLQTGISMLYNHNRNMTVVRQKNNLLSLGSASSSEAYCLALAIKSL